MAFLTTTTCPFCRHIYGPTSLTKKEESSPTGKSVQDLEVGSKRHLEFTCSICGAKVEMDIVVTGKPTKPHSTNLPTK